MNRFLAVSTIVLSSLLLAAGHGVQEPAPKGQLDELRADVKRLEALLPDQAAVMSHPGYHWSNLWFALEQENRRTGRWLTSTWPRRGPT